MAASLPHRRERMVSSARLEPSSRTLRPEEHAVISREFRADARIVRVFSWLIALLVPPCLALAVRAFSEGGWFGALVGFLTILLALLCLLPLLMRRRTVAAAPYQLRAVTVHDRCETRLDSGDPTHAAHYVGPYRVLLRPGWLAFWPEGQDATVELCFPPKDVDATWVGAAVVSLPGIDIRKWSKYRPPKPRGVVASYVSVFCFSLTVVCGIFIFSEGYGAEVASRFRNRGESTHFATVTELLRTPRALHARVTITTAHRVGRPGDGVYLCDLREPMLSLLSPHLEPPEPSERQILTSFTLLCSEEKLAYFEELALGSRLLGHNDPATLRTQVERHCRGRAEAHARNANLVRVERERKARISHELNANPKTSCLREYRLDGRVPASTSSSFLRVVHDTTGVLEPDRVFRAGAPAPSLTALVWLVLGTLATAASGYLGWRGQRQGVPSIDEWARALRSEGRIH